MKRQELADAIADMERVANEWPDGIHTCAELQQIEPGRRSCTCGRCVRRSLSVTTEATNS